MKEKAEKEEFCVILKSYVSEMSMEIVYVTISQVNWDVLGVANLLPVYGCINKTSYRVYFVNLKKKKDLSTSDMLKTNFSLLAQRSDN